MRLFLSERDRAHLRWRYFGRPYLIAFGVAAAIGLGIGVVWVIAGILHFHPLW